MVNKLYSILVSGSDDIPADFAMWRKHTKIEKYVDYRLPHYTDPYRRSLWANALIELSKCSSLYPDIVELDPANTYDISPTILSRTTTVDGVKLIGLSSDYPVLDLELTIGSNGVCYTCNGGTAKIEEINSDRIIDVLGFTFQIDEGITTARAYISNPAVSVDIPSIKTVSGMMHDLGNAAVDIDLEYPWDRASAFCLHLLRGYNVD